MFFSLAPEVAGGWGKNTLYTRTPGKPTVVHKLHYHFDGWLGDELLTSTPCFIVSERLCQAIQRAELNGVRFDEVEVTTSDQFNELYPGRHLPKFIWLRVEGKPGQDDFGLAPSLQLVVSAQALEVLTRMNLRHCGITPYEN